VDRTIITATSHSRRELEVPGQRCGSIAARARVRARALAALLIFVITAAGVFAAPSAVRAAGGFPNGSIADVALRYVGQWGGNACADAGKPRSGTCKQFANCVIYLASGGRYYPAPGYQSAFAAVGIEVSSASAVRGDVIQVGDSDSVSSLHTAIVLQNYGAGQFQVVDSNWGLNEMVTVHNYALPAGARIWRLGDVGGGSSRCAGPSLGSPPNGATVGDRTISFSWSPPGGCSSSGYTFRVRGDPNMDDPNGNHYVDTGLAGTSYTATINNHDNQTLYWGVRAANAPAGADWSIRTFRIQAGIAVSTPLVLAPAAPVAGEPVVATFGITNTSSSPITLSRLIVAVRGPGCVAGDFSCATGLDFPAVTGLVLGAGQTYRYSAQAAFATPGSWFARAAYLDPSGTWHSTDVGSVRVDFPVVAGLQVVGPVSLSPASPSADQPVTATYTARNASSRAITVPLLGLVTRGPSCAAGTWSCVPAVDFPTVSNVTIAAGSTYTYRAMRSFSTAGPGYFAQPGFSDGSIGWWYPVDQGAAAPFSVTAGIAVSTPLVLAPAAPVAGTTPSTSTGVRITTLWSATAGQGSIDHYAVQLSIDGGTFAPLESTTALARTYTLARGHQYRIRVQASDAAGELSGWATSARILPVVYQETSPRVVYQGSWSTLKGSSYHGGRDDRYATAAGASATFSLTGRGVAWVGSLGSTRGSANDYVNGALVATVNLHASTPIYLRVVWSKTWSSSAKRAVKVVIASTAKRLRVDVDSFLALG
jgi:hypothetical protein